ncbi:MAG: PepSY domain-containing protein [Gemmatimonadetes bacterium]|jgi:uncharacterized iron-regulated membrane protein|nr:PepSY domain-containing protein [Gemmatimonadota bacterium]MBK6842435.1 PepSY domain-containing protein [Gemmatimonadota bacterium]
MNVTRFLLWLHKWIGIVMGVIVLVWLVSGMVMILPFYPVVDQSQLATPNMRQAVISPAAATEIAVVREQGGSEPRKVQLIPVGGDPYYKIDLMGGKSFLISAIDGERLLIKREVAEGLARRGLPPAVRVRAVSEITEHSLANPRGPVPAFRFEFDDPSETTALVGIRDGVVMHTDGRKRIRAFVTGLHTFDQLELLVGDSTPKKGALHLTSIISIVLVMSGYYVVLPRRWRRRWETRKQPTT